MGVRHLAAALYGHVGIPPTAKLILVAIADHINDETGYGWPSTSRLARICGLDKRNVLRWVLWLETEGHITVQRKTGRSNGYRMTGDTSVTSDTSASGATVTTPVIPASPDRWRQRHPNQKEPEGNRRRAPKGDAPTPTPPPLKAVLAQQEKYR